MLKIILGDMKLKITCFFIFLFFFSISLPESSQAVEKVGIDEHLGAKVPLNLKFVNSSSDTVILSNLITKPTLLYFVYFHCGGICNPLQNSVADAIGRLKLKAGEDYNIITVCFDAKATTEDAKKWKNNSLQVMNMTIAPDVWNVLTGDSNSIKKLTDAVGFYYKSDGQGDFIHAGSIFAISPTGIICRYLYFDKNYNPFDLKMALLEAGQNKTNPTLKTVLQFCFSYDPQGKHYVFNTTRVIGVLMLLSSAGLFLFLFLSGRKKNKIMNLQKVSNE